MPCIAALFLTMKDGASALRYNLVATGLFCRQRFGLTRSITSDGLLS